MSQETVRIVLHDHDVQQQVSQEFEHCAASQIKAIIIQQRNREANETYELPSRLQDFTAVETLSLQGNLSSLPIWIGNLQTLTSLNLTSCSKLINLPESVGNLHDLTSLDLSYCDNLVSLPESIGNLSKLAILNIRYCSKFVSLPESIGNLSHLTSLNLTSCFNFETLPNIFFLPQLQTIKFPNGRKLNLGPGSDLKLLRVKQLGLTGIRSLPVWINKFHELTSLDLSDCSNLLSLPDSLGNLSKLTTLNLKGCLLLQTFPNIFQFPHLDKFISPNGDGYWMDFFDQYRETGELDLRISHPFTALSSGIGNLSTVKSLTLRYCSTLESLPESIGNLSTLQSLVLIECANITSLPDSIGNLSSLTSLSLTDCYNLESLPESIGNLSNLTSLDLSGCSKLVSIPSTIGNLSNLTTLDLTLCMELISLPTSLQNLTNLSSPLHISAFEIPLDLDWSEFGSSITLQSYLEYAMRKNAFPFEDMSSYMDIFNPDSFFFRSHCISDVDRLIERRSGGGVDLIGYLCSMLTNDGVNRNGESEFIDRFMQWTNNESKEYGITFLTVLYLNVYGKEMIHEDTYEPFIFTGRRVREVWKDEGKEDSERRREWKKRWREGTDIMSEEDMTEVCVMHLCIPDSRSKQDRHAVTPSQCALQSFRVLLNEEVDLKHPHHFPVYEVKNEPPNVLIIRNLPPEFDTESDMGNELTEMVNNIAEVDYIEQEEGSYAAFEKKYINEHPQYSVIRVTLLSDEYAAMVERRLDGSEFYGKYLSVKQGLGIPRHPSPQKEKKKKYKKSRR